jgi:CHAT domain-containing protein/tetratricopeptide (TPR) repeat protein
MKEGPCLAWFLLCLIAGHWMPASGREEPRASYIELREMIGRSEFDQAIERGKALIAQYPGYVPLYETLPEVCQYADRLEEAIGFFERRVEDGTQLGLAYFGLGYGRYLQEDYREAVSNLTRAIEIGVRAPVLYKYFQYSHEKIDGVDGSIRLLATLSHRYPDNACFWYATALAYWSKNDFKQALRFLSEASSRRPKENEFRYARTAALYLCGRSLEAEASVENVIESAEADANFGASLWLRSYVVGQFLRSRAFSEAGTSCRRMIADAKRYGYHRWLGWGWYRLSDAVQLQGDYRSALPFMKQAVQSAVLCRDSELMKFSLASEFEIYIEAGEYAQAMRVALRNAQLCQSRRDIAGQASALNDLARIYYELGESAIALTIAREALTAAETAPLDDRTLCQIHSTIGLAYEGLGQSTEALRHFIEADHLNPDDGFRGWLASITKGNIGSACLHLGRLSDARVHFSAQHLLARRAQYDREVAYALANIGQCEYLQNRYAAAVAHFDSALSIARIRGYRPISLLCAKWLGRANEATGHLPEAAHWYRQMDLLADSMVTGLDGLGFKRRLLDFHEYYSAYIDLLSRMKLDENAFEISDCSKVACGYLVESGVPAGAVGGSRVRDLLCLNASARILLEVVANMFTGEPLSQWISANPGKQTGDIAALIKVQSEYLSLLDSLTELQEIPYFQRGRNVSLLQRIRNSVLQEGEALIEYFVGSSSTHIFFVSLNEFRHVSIQIGRDRLQNLLTEVSPIIDPNRRAHSVWNAGLANFDLVKASGLYEVLVKGIEADMAGVNKIAVVADDALSSLPFESLVINPGRPKSAFDYSRAIFLVQSHEVRYLRSAAPAFLEGVHRPSRKALLAVPASAAGIDRRDADFFQQRVMSRHAFTRLRTLPGVEREVERILDIFGSTADILPGQFAKESLGSLAKDYAILHFSAHAESVERYGGREMLCLGPATLPSGNQALTGPDLVGMELCTELAVLSLCQAGPANKAVADRELVRGVLLAGVPSVIAALWVVDDGSAPTLMQSFYAYLKAGETRGHALQLAKIQMIKNGQGDPFYWGAFILLGNGSAIEFSQINDELSARFYGSIGIAVIICSTLLLAQILYRYFAGRVAQQQYRASDWLSSSFGEH